MNAQPLYVQQCFFFFFGRFFYVWPFYLEISVKVANSRSYGPILILTEVLEIHIFTSGGLFRKKLLDFGIARKLLDFSMARKIT